MTDIHRREMLRVMLGGAVIGAAGLTMRPVAAESAEEAAVVVRRPRRRVHRRRPLVCWWQRGRRVCRRR